LLESLHPDKRHVFLQPDESLPTSSLNVVKETLEGFAAEVGEEQEARLKESRKRKRESGLGGRRGEIEVLKLRKVYVDGFETEQVWQQARRIITSVLKFSGGVLDELEEKGEVVAGEKGDDGLGDAEEVDAEEQDEDEDEDELDGELDEDELEDDELDGEDEEDIEALENGLEEDLSGLDEDEEEEEDEDEEEQQGQEYVEDPDGLNDGFFNIDEFNRQSQYFEEQDARGDPNTDRASDDEEIDWDADPMTQSTAGSKMAGRNGKSQDGAKDQLKDEDEDDEEEDGPTFGDMALDAPEGASDDEFDGDEEAADDEGLDLNANGIYYKDFFAPPPRKSKGGKPKKSVHFKPEQPAQEDVDRAMADVRRDLFDDESDNDDSEDALSDVSAGDPKSRRSAHERRQAKLAEEIRKLEAASVAKREWTLSGEAAAADRPLNSLLEEDLDFEHVGKPVPVITPEVTEGIEDMIKRRILAQEFDEVLRRRPDAEAVPSGTRRGMVEQLDDSKPSKGLAEVYEEEHVKKANPDAYVSQSDEKLQREEREIEALWKDVSARLDALSSWNYRPKPAAPSVSVVADVAAVAMEDAQPTTASAISGEQSRMAPQEVYKAGAQNAAPGEIVTSAGLPVARQEMSREDKVRRRRRAKERIRKAGADGAAASTTSGAAGGAAKKTLSTKAKMQRDTIAELKKGGVKVINRKGEITDVEGKKTKVAAKVVSGGSFKL
ncbi:Mpp10 protein, partial [Trichoderma reesei RUT C-30]